MSAGADGRLEIWNIEGLTHDRTIEVNPERISCAAIDDTRTKVISADWSGDLRLWNLVNGRCKQVLRCERHSDSSGYINDIAFDNSGTIAVSVHADDSLRVWDCENGACLQEIRGDFFWPAAVAFNSNNRLACAGGDGALRVWEMDIERTTHRVESRRDTVYNVVISANGSTAASLLESDVVIWSVITGDRKPMPRGIISLFSISDIGDLILVSTDENQTILLWDTVNCETRFEIRNLERLESAVLSGDGKYLAFSLGDYVEVWDITTKARILRLDQTEYFAYHVAISGDSRYVFSWSEKESLLVKTRDPPALLGRHP